MTGHFFLDWAIMAVSLFNTVLLLWLGLTVLLNAERRRWGVWLAGGGLLLGSAFFVSHSAILGHGPTFVGPGVNFWWRVGWLPVALLPLAWYAVVLWYAGFWEGRETGVARWCRWHRLGLGLTALLAAGSVGLLLLAHPLPTFTQVLRLDLWAVPAIRGKPVLILVYPPYVLLCLILSLDALRHAHPSRQDQQDGPFTKTLARRRAHPWLAVATGALLAASALVALVMAQIVLYAGRYRRVAVGANRLVGGLDLAIAALIALATVALGQAIVAYEVFTARTLPRRGLRRDWRNAIILAAGYSVAVGGGLTVGLRAIYSLLLTALLMTLFLALSSWRAYAERQRYIQHLRPFVASQRLYEQLVTPSAPWVDATTPFRALCRDVLGAKSAHLVALGPLAPLAGPPLTYPDGASPPPSTLAELLPRFSSPQTMCVPLDPSKRAGAGGATWAVPLWSERGLIGVLLLGAKRDGGLYTREEIEIARASGERLVDTQASVAMARRLMALQRQRLAESQVLDRRTRRALHDDVLPCLHTAMLSLEGASEETLALLTDVHRQISDLLHEMPMATTPQVARLGVFGALRQTVEQELEGAFERVTWRIEAPAEAAAARLSPLTAEVLFYAAREAVRNAARHARDPQGDGPLYLDVFGTAREGLQIFIEDNGVGLDATGPAGEESAPVGAPDGGHGLALHGTMMAVVGGSLAVESVPEEYTRVLLTLPPAALA